MKFQCASCGLRMESLHFKEAGLVNPKLDSICDICRQRGLRPDDYANDVIAIFAQHLLYTFVGQKQKKAAEHYLVANKQARKAYEAFLQDFDGNELAQQQLPRPKLYGALIKYEDEQKYPDAGLTFAENLQQLGLNVNFQLNEVDFIDRERVRAKYNYRCQYCGRKGRSVDHMDPVSLSHDNNFDNLILSCSECNRIKSNMPFTLFKRLNDQIPEINKKLVRYENALTSLKTEFVEKKRLLAAKVHLKGVINDPELNQIRKENKRLQDAIDSLASDYDSLRKTREDYFITHWKLAKLKRQEDII